MGRKTEDSQADNNHSEPQIEGDEKTLDTMLVNPGSNDDRDMREIRAFLRNHGFDVTVDEIRRLRRVTTDDF